MVTLLGCLSSRRRGQLPSGSTDLSTRPTSIRLFNYASAALSLAFDSQQGLEEPQIVAKRASILVNVSALPHASSITTGSSVTIPLHVRSLDGHSESDFDLDFTPSTHDEEWIRLEPHPVSHRGTRCSSDEHSSLNEEKPSSEVAPTPFWGLQSNPQMKRGQVDLLLFDSIPTSQWMSYLPDQTVLSSLCIPGTHETLARFGFPQAQCQNEQGTVSAQLRAGIRFLDIRLIAKPSPDNETWDGKGDETLYAYHGKVDERITFDEVLNQIWEFLDGDGSDETLVMSIKSEAEMRPMQERLQRHYIAPTRDRWWLQSRVPTLGEARGKIVLFSRFGNVGEADLGLHPPVWPDNLDGLWTYQLAGGETFATQDWFRIRTLGSLNHKWALIQRLAGTYGPQKDVYAMNYVSANTSPWAYPHHVSKGRWWFKGLNPRLRDYVAQRFMIGTNFDSLGCFFLLDFYDVWPDLVPLLIQANFV